MSWIKVETHTFDKIEIYTIAQELTLDPDSVFAKCCRIWAWFDANTIDGVTKSVTKALLDRHCSVTGFCKAMINAGWMHDDGENLQLPYYERHNSKSAKARALGSKRNAKYKINTKGDAIGDGEGDAVGDDTPSLKSSHREEKRRSKPIVLFGFDEFWKIYPKKAGKDPASKSWAKLSPDDDLIKKIMSALDVAVQSKDWLKEDGQYIPNATTWINQKRWEDYGDDLLVPQKRDWI